MSTVALQRPPPAAEDARQPPRSPLTPRELLTPLFLHWRAALLAFLIPLALAAGVAFVAKPVFVAQARLLILLGGDYVFRDLRDPNGAGQSQSFDRQQIVHAETEILAARDLHRQTIQDIGLARAYPDLARRPDGMVEAEEQFDRDLKIADVPQSNIIGLTLRSRDPRVAADLLNRLVQNYIARRRQVFDLADGGPLRRQREALDRQLADVEGRLARFAAGHGIGDYAEAVTAAQTQRTGLAGQLDAVDQQIATRAGRGAALTRRASDLPQTVEISQDQARSQQLDALTASLLAVQTQRRDAAAKFRDDYPLVVELDRRIAELQAQIRAAPAQQTAAVRRGANPVRQQIDGFAADAEGDVAGLRLGREQVRRALAAAEKRLAELVDVGPEYRDLVRRRAAAEAAYQDLARNTEDARLQGALARARANVRVIEAAEPPAHGKTGRLAVLAAGLVLGAAAALAVVVVSAAGAQTMTTPRDVEQKLRVPVLLAAPWRRGAAPVKKGAPAKDGSAPLQPAFLSVDEAKLLLRIVSSVSPAPGRVLQLISATGGAGVSALALDLAIVAANQGAGRVLLLDIEPQPGEGAAARLAQAGVRLTPTPGRSRILRVGETPLYVGAALGRREPQGPQFDWTTVLDAARKGFDLVVLDSPPAERSSAGVLLAASADMTLAVIEAEHTRAAVAANLVDLVDDAGGEVMGAILNKRRFHIPPFIYARL